MTGYGESQSQEDGVTVAVEIRTINSRYLKLSVKSPEAYSVLEGEIETVARQQIKRGTVQINLRVDRPESPEAYRLNASVLSNYRTQLSELLREWKLTQDVRPESLLQLPGVIHESVWSGSEATETWPLIRRTLEDAFARLAQMRADEGAHMANDLRANCDAIASELKCIEERASVVVDSYRQRLEERLRKVLDEYQVTLNPSDVIREVSIFAERSDISEEIVRLRSHLVQFAAFMVEKESTGRKLEFLTQEMFRETNTIGSKANDVPIARHVIEIKAAIEKIREMIQNVE
jgi:uncharacterized protein (TIGR00255 family)